MRHPPCSLRRALRLLALAQPPSPPACHPLYPPTPQTPCPAEQPCPPPLRPPTSLILAQFPLPHCRQYSFRPSTSNAVHRLGCRAYTEWQGRMRRRRGGRQ